MANEIALTVNLAYTKDGATVSMGVSNKLITVTGKRFAHIRQSIGTSEEAIDLGDAVPTGGWFIAINRDATNFVSIRQGTGTTNLVRLNAGEVCCFRMHASTTAPFAIADTAAVDMEMLLIEN